MVKQAILDTDILSEFLRGNKNVYAKVEAYVREYGFVSLSIITYYEILNGLLYKDARKQMGNLNSLPNSTRSCP